jgi:CPA2 family monovalent cation:H+ antiporter-2
MHSPLLSDLVVLLLVSIAVLYASHLVKLPAIVAFLVSGVLLGPHGFGLVHGVEEVEQLAEIGVILLLFTIGLEFSLADLMRMRRVVLLGGTIQVVVVTAAIGLAASLTGLPANQAVFLGMIASLSSTAVVLRLLQQRAEVDAPHGRMSLGILVYQDLMIVPMTLLVPVLSGASGGLGSAVVAFVLKTVAVLVAVLLLARFVVPQLLHRVVQSRSRDLFLMTVVTVCLAIAWAAGVAGLSLALGAFLAGLLISESEYSHQALADILPFRDLFASFFFISIGMLLDVGLMVESPIALGAMVGGVLALKIVGATVAVLVLGGSLRTSITTGLAMSQVGEFSFVLAGTGIAAGLLTDGTYQWFVAAAVTTIGVTPFILTLAGPLTAMAGGLPFAGRFRTGVFVPEDLGGAEERKDHLVVIGYGMNGRNVAHAARIAGIPYVAVDMNPVLVASERRDGVAVHYGDATRQAFLEHLGTARAHAVVVAISDAAATRRITALARDLNPSCAIIARTRYVHEVEELIELGATTVIPEELETSIEIVSRVLSSYLVPRGEIDAFVSEVRADGYEMLRRRPAAAGSLHDLSRSLTDIGITTLRVHVGSAIAGSKLVDTDLRRLYGVSVLAIRRGEDLLPNPSGEELLQPDDLLVVMGLGEEVAAAAALLRTPDEAGDG